MPSRTALSAALNAKMQSSKQIDKSRARGPDSKPINAPTRDNRTYRARVGKRAKKQGFGVAWL